MADLGVSEAVTAAAAFVGGWVGQRRATGQLAKDVAALTARLELAERRATRLWSVVAELGRRVRGLGTSAGDR